MAATTRRREGLGSLRPVRDDQPQPPRTIPDPGFTGDTGALDPALARALAAYAGDAGLLPGVLAALHRARVLAPVVAVLGETGTTPAGLTVDKRADIALPLLVDPGGARAVPVFSSLESMARWDPSARPVPVAAARAAAVALAEQAEALLLDVAGPHPVTLGLPEVRALVDGRGSVPAYDDEPLRVALHQALAVVPEVEAAWLGPWPGTDARLTVRLVEGTDPAATAQDVVAAVRELAPLAGGGVRGLDLAVLTSAGPGPPARPVFTRHRTPRRTPPCS